MALKIGINAIGIISERELIVLNTEYTKRIKWALSVNEFSHSSTNNIIIDQQKEAERLWSKIQPSDYVIALDENGKTFSSTEFAQLIKGIEERGASKLYFLLGGSTGHDKSTLDRAKLTISLGRMTSPHKLARLFLIEQIYRAQSILFNHPYHK